MVKSKQTEVSAKYNAANIFVDRHIEEGRGDKVAIYFEDQKITYREIHQKVNQTGNALQELGLGMEDRVMLLLLDCPLRFVRGTLA